jgi:hypothetical protein
VLELEYQAVTVGGNPLAPTYGGSGTYGGFDQFGQVVDQRWETVRPGTIARRSPAGGSPPAGGVLPITYKQPKDWGAGGAGTTHPMTVTWDCCASPKQYTKVNTNP